MYRVSIEFGRTRNAVGKQAAGEWFRSFFEFSQTFRVGKMSRNNFSLTTIIISGEETRTQQQKLALFFQFSLDRLQRTRERRSRQTPVDISALSESFLLLSNL